jgi:glycosyltransferase involved in cell wall biosynthesis
MTATRRLRVALMITARDWRGSGVVLAEIARALRAAGHEAQALVARAPLEAGFAAAGVPVRRLPIGDTGIREARALHAALRVLDADVVVVDAPRDIRLAAASSLFRPVGIVYALSRPHPPRDLLTRLSFPRVSLSVFLTEKLAATALAIAPFMARRPHRVIPNGVDTTFFRPDPAAGTAFRARHGLGSDGPLLVAVSSLSPEKRLDILLDALARVPAPRPPLVVCGAGGLESPLRAQAARLGLDVRWLGQQPPGELLGAYNAATIVVHSRPLEPFALSLIEALACGRPVLAPAGGGTPELLVEAGVLVPPEDPAAMGQTLAALLGDGERRATLSAAARARAQHRFSLERMRAEWVDTLERVSPVRFRLASAPL